METPETIRTSLQAGEWVTFTDFKAHTSTFRFKVSQGSICIFMSRISPTSSKLLSFGLSTAPMEFMVVAKEVKLVDLQRCIRIHQYLDDLSPAYTDSSLPGITVVGQQGEIRSGSQTGLQLRRLPVRPERGQGHTHHRASADLNSKNSSIIDRSSLNYLELKVVFLALKEFGDLCLNNIVLIATDNTTVVAYINKEGGDEVGPCVCPSMENPDLVLQETGDPQSPTHSRPAECNS